MAIVEKFSGPTRRLTNNNEYLKFHDPSHKLSYILLLQTDNKRKENEKCLCLCLLTVYLHNTLLLRAATGLKWLLITVSRSWKHIIPALSDPDENKCVAFVLASRQLGPGQEWRSWLMMAPCLKLICI